MYGNLEQDSEQLITSPQEELVAEVNLNDVEVDFNDADAVVKALQDEQINFSKVPKAQREVIRRAFIQKELELAYEEGNEEKAAALRNNWAPKSVYGGKKADGSERPFRDYEEFNRIIRENAPVQNERLRTFSKEMEEMRRENRKLLEMSQMSFERSISNDERSIESQIREARENGDFDSYDALMIRKQELQQGKLYLKEDKPPVQTEVPYEVKEWGARNQWFRTDQQMTQWAVAQEDILQETRPDLNRSQRLELISKSAKISFPDRFPEENTKATVSSSRTSGSFSPNRKVEFGFSNLPEVEKLQARQMIRNGVFKDESDFIKSYNQLKK